MKQIKFNRAFSLIELSIVILIIGILVSAVIKGRDLYANIKLVSAKNITNNSIVSSTKDLVAWYEASSGSSFLEDETQNGSILSSWRDINPQSTSKKHTISATGTPQYVIDENLGLPVVDFNGSSYFTLPNGTVPSGNASYSIFIVAKVNNPCVCVVLASGLSANSQNTFRFSTSGDDDSFYNYGHNASEPWISIKRVNFDNEDSYNIITHIYNGSQVSAYVNSNLIAGPLSISRNSEQSPNYIGRKGDNLNENMNGQIAEIIIFDRALKDNERQSIDEYLSQKFSIRL